MPGPPATTFNKTILNVRPPDFLLVTPFQRAPSPFNIICFTFFLVDHYPYHNFVIPSHVEIIIIVLETLKQILCWTPDRLALLYFSCLWNQLLPRQDIMSLWYAFPSYKSILSFCHFPFNSPSLVNPSSKMCLKVFLERLNCCDQ